MKTKLFAVISVGLLPLTLVAASGRYGPVNPQETLWSIATQQRPEPSISVQQMMFAIRDANPNAFSNGDIHALHQGVYLYIPSAKEVWANKAALRTVSKTELRREILTLRQRLADAQTQSEQLNTQLQTEQQQSQVLKVQLQTLQQQSAKNATAAEVAKLQQLLEERDTHVQQLQASLRQASITIKRQYAESVALHEQLKALDPHHSANATAPTPVDEAGTKTTAPNLTLAAPPDNASNAAVAANLPAGVSVRSWLEQQVAAQQAGDSPQISTARTPSWVSLAIATLAACLIAGLWWRNKKQQQALQTQEAALRATLTPDELPEAQDAATTTAPAH